MAVWFVVEGLPSSVTLGSVEFTVEANEDKW